jgi:hypothetical protein
MYLIDVASKEIITYHDKILGPRLTCPYSVHRHHKNYLS